MHCRVRSNRSAISRCIYLARSPSLSGAERESVRGGRRAAERRIRASRSERQTSCRSSALPAKRRISSFQGIDPSRQEETTRREVHPLDCSIVRFKSRGPRVPQRDKSASILESLFAFGDSYS